MNSTARNVRPRGGSPKKTKKTSKGLQGSASTGGLKGSPGKTKLATGTVGAKSEFLKLPPSLMKKKSSNLLSFGSLSNIYDSGEEDESDDEKPINYHNRRKEFKQKWLVLIAHALRLGCLDHYCKHSFEAIHERTTLQRERYMCVMKAVSFVVKRVHWVMERLARRKEIFRKHGWRFVLSWKCRKRREAVRAVRAFFLDHRNFRLAYMMLRFRSNALALQTRVRNFIQVNNARVFALTRLWIRIEKKIRDSMLPKVKQVQLDQSHQKHMDLLKCEAWEATRLTGVVLPSLADHVNSCTKSAIQLKKILNEGKEIQIKVSNAEMSRRIKHMQQSRKLGSVPKPKKKRKKQKRAELTADTMSVRERTIRNFLSECRRQFKAEQSFENTLPRNDMVHKSASQNKIPTELAMKLIKSRNLADMRSVEASIQELLVAEAEMAQQLRVYTGENAGKFYYLVEEYVKNKIDEMMMMC